MEKNNLRFCYFIIVRDFYFESYHDKYDTLYDLFAESNDGITAYDSFD
jgi:hypothetical protein